MSKMLSALAATAVLTAAPATTIAQTNMSSSGQTYKDGTTKGASSGRRSQERATREIPHCTKMLGTVAIVEPDNQWWRELNLGSPEAILKVFVQQSGCFRMVNRGRSMQSRAMERALADQGELQEGSTWEALMMASSFGVSNLVALIDNNDFQSLGRTSVTHPSFYPLRDKLEAFGWEVAETDGHNSGAIYDAIAQRSGDKPFALIGATTKGKGVSYMENVPMWHYRSPNQEEYEQAMRELGGAE